jgi:uncharacterized membrane protein YccC
MAVDTSLASRMQSLRAELGTGPNYIALSAALRATLATVLPLVLLPRFGRDALAYPAVLGALATSLVDVGGPYRTRLLAMLAQALLGAGLLLFGSVAARFGWLAGALMAAIGIGSGLIRALGQGGVSLGINMSVALLVGIQLGAFGVTDPLTWAFGYAIGGLWTVVVALAFWGLRPYRRLVQEVASVWEAVATLLEAAVADAGTDSKIIERRVAAAHAAVRAALEQARESLGDLRASAVGSGVPLAQLMALLEAAAGVAACGVTVCEAAINAAELPADLSAELARTCRAVAHALLHVRSDSPRMRSSVERALMMLTRAESCGPESSGERRACAQALRHLDDAEQALRALLGVRSTLPDLLRLPIAHRRPRGVVINALRTHATAQSPIFRHAMRTSTVGALSTVFLIERHLPHGIWLPISALAILQPEYGGTITRALQRSLGTVAGAVIASVLLATVRGTAFYNAVLGALLFATFLVIRRNYGYGIAFLTPLVILLIGRTSANPWVDLGERVAYTMGGALLALAAGYLLWPQWERDQLRERLARAIDATKAYLDAVLQALVDRSVPAEKLAALQRQAEMSVSNADAGLQRMAMEPARSQPLSSTGFAVLVYLRRLCRHAIALSAQVGIAAVNAEPLARLRKTVGEVLEDLRHVIGEARRPVPWPSIAAQLSELVAQAGASGNERGAAAQAATLLSYLERDLTGLLNAAGYPDT